MTNVMQGSTKTLDQAFHILYWRYLNIVINTKKKTYDSGHFFSCFWIIQGLFGLIRIDSVTIENVFGTIFCYFASLHIYKLSKIRKDAILLIHNNNINV